MPGVMAGQGKEPETKAPVSNGGFGASGQFSERGGGSMCRCVCRLGVHLATQVWAPATSTSLAPNRRDPHLGDTQHSETAKPSAVSLMMLPGGLREASPHRRGGPGCRGSIQGFVEWLRAMEMYVH